MRYHTKDQTSKQIREIVIRALRSLGIFNITITTNTGTQPHMIFNIPRKLEQNEIDMIAKQIFFYLEDTVISNIDELIYLNQQGDLIINYANFDTFSGILSKFKELGRKVINCRISDSCISFSYARYVERALDYQELEQIQNIINPAIPEHDSIRVIGMFETYTLFAHTAWLLYAKAPINLFPV